MNTPRKSRFCLVFGLGLAAAILCGCPVKASCPNCEYLTATFTVTPENVAGMTSATMHTHVVVPATECRGAECNVTRTDDVTCKLQGITSTQTKTQKMPVLSTVSSTHEVTIQIQKGTGPATTLDATVGTPSDPAPPTMPLCP